MAPCMMRGMLLEFMLRYCEKFIEASDKVPLLNRSRS
jgi:hypothetical protein